MSFVIPLSQHRLSNGLHVVLAPDPGAGVVAVNIWYSAGSRDEPVGKTGLAHLVEHMMFRGSPHVALVEGVGGTTNARTWFDQTTYDMTLPPHALTRGLWLESDRMGWLGPGLSQDQLVYERDTVLAEKRARYDNQPYGDWHRRLLRLAFPPTHPYHHPVIGTDEDIATLSLTDVRAFHRAFYLPRNAVLTLVGDFSPGRALELIAGYFEDIPARPEAPLREPVPPLGPIGGARRDHAAIPVPLPHVTVAYRSPPYVSPDYPLVEVARTLLGAGPGSYLHRELVLRRGIATESAAITYPLRAGSALLITYAIGLPSTSVEELEDAIAVAVRALSTAPYQDLARAVSILEASILESYESAPRRADLISRHASCFGDAESINDVVQRLRAIEPKDIHRLAEHWLGIDSRAVLVFAPSAVTPGFYPTNADASEKLHLGRKGVSWQSDEGTARGSNGKQ